MSQAYQNQSKSDEFKQIYQKYTIDLEEGPIHPYTIIHSEDDGSLNADQNEASKRTDLLDSVMDEEEPEQEVPFSTKEDLRADMSTFG